MRAHRHGAVRAAAERLTVGFHAPLPPAPTGVADYAAALLAALRPLGDVRPGAATAGVDLYHIGNNQLHRDIHRRALERPGVSVLHDAVLNHFYLGTFDEEQYVREFVYNYGAWDAGLARSLWRGRARSATDPVYFERPMLKRIAERSLAVIVHNPGAAARVKAHAPQAIVEEIPHLFCPPALAPIYEVERLRNVLTAQGRAGGFACLGRSQPSDRGAFLFGVFGHLRESKRLAAILRAFDNVRRSANIALLIAGEFASSDLQRSLAPIAALPGVVRVGHLTEPDFWLYASAVDACINLRYPPAGETSGIAIRLMGIGKPVLLSDGLETSRFPESACVKLDTGAREQPMLEAAMYWLASNPADAREIGVRAAAHIREHHSLDQVAARYWRLLARHETLRSSAFIRG